MLSRTLVAQKVADALRQAMSGIAGGAGGLLDPAVLTQVIAAGSDGATRLSAAPQRTWIEYGGIFVAGNFERTAQTPTARLTLNGTRADATLSTVPGAGIATVTWTVDGDVTEQAYERRELSMALEPGTHAVTVAITTDEGESASASATFNVS